MLTSRAAELVGPDGDVLAIDSSVDALDDLRAKTAAPNVSYLIGLADVLPLMDESVDVVVTHETVAAPELFRVLRSGGRISIYGELGDLEQLFKGVGFTDVRTSSAARCLTAVKP